MNAQSISLFETRQIREVITHRIWGIRVRRAAHPYEGRQFDTIVRAGARGLCRSSRCSQRLMTGRLWRCSAWRQPGAAGNCTRQCRRCCTKMAPCGVLPGPLAVGRTFIPIPTGNGVRSEALILISIWYRAGRERKKS